MSTDVYEGQMTIFDILGDFGTLSEEEVVASIGQRLGIKFKLEVLPPGTYCSHLDYEFKRKGLRLTVACCISVEGKSVISCGYSKGTSGGGAPCYSLDEAVDWFKFILELYEEKK